MGFIVELLWFSNMETKHLDLVPRLFQLIRTQDKVEFFFVLPFSNYTFSTN